MIMKPAMSYDVVCVEFFIDICIPDRSCEHSCQVNALVDIFKQKRKIYSIDYAKQLAIFY